MYSGVADHISLGHLTESPKNGRARLGWLRQTKREDSDLCMLHVCSYGQMFYCRTQKLCRCVFAALKVRGATQNHKVCFACNEGNSSGGNLLTRPQCTREREESPDGSVRYSDKLERLLTPPSAVPKAISGDKWRELSITVRKRFVRLSERREARKKRKHIKAQSRTEDKPSKLIKSGDRLSKYEVKQLQKESLAEAMRSGLRLAIDCGFESAMSHKEICKLASQIGHLYGSNKKARKPFHLYLSRLHPQGELAQQCRHRYAGFDSFAMDVSQSPVWDIAEKENLVFLTPDSTSVLGELDSSKMYVVGGVVDESIKKHVTANFCRDNGLSTTRLPIPEYMEQGPGSRAHAILTVNQVVDILLHVHSTGDWPTALQENIPLRKNFKLRPGKKMLSP